MSWEQPRADDLSWTPPTYSVDRDGRVIGAVCEHEPNNWGRWGRLDERGTTNFITPEHVAAAGKLIEHGRTFSLALPIAATGPTHPLRPPVIHRFAYAGTDFLGTSALAQEKPGYQGTDDMITMPLQGSTQWDGLGHAGFRDTFYNGFWIGTSEAFSGNRRLGIEHLRDTLVGRGVLLDLARFRGVDRLPPGHAIGPDELDACAAAQGVEVRSGDLLLLRTGHVEWFYELEDKAPFFAGAPGVGAEAVEWIHRHEIAALCVDNVAVEVEPFQPGVEAPYPLHVRLIRDLGLLLGELWWLADLAADCAADGTYEFFLSAPPLHVPNGSGSPLNPMAIK
jgi:kynurenine formamidase